MWLKIDDSLMFMNGDSVSSMQEIPIKTYKVVFDNKHGSFLKEAEIKTEHGKIYGKSQSIADHIVESFNLISKERNLGVLLSGGRGLGKTLTTRLVVEQLKEKYPIIMVSDYTPDLADFLSQLKNCVILMDEFEKFMGGNIRGNDAEEEQTKQETILSVLDGNTGCSGNLFLLTANDVWKLDSNLKSRPGRIRYHYRFDSENSDVVRGYCADNLIRKEITEDIVKVLGAAKYVSLDIITSFVDELNKFPNLTPLQVIDFFNIESADSNYKILIHAEINGHNVVYERKFRNYLSADWCQLSHKYRDLLTKREVPEHLSITLEEENMPTYIYGKENIDVSLVELEDINNYDNDKVSIDDVNITSVVIEDPDYSQFAKKYNKSAL